MKEKAEDVWAVVSRTILGAIIGSLAVAVFWGAALVCLTYPAAVMFVIVSLMLLLVCYIVGNLTVRKWRKYARQKQYERLNK